MNSISGPSPSYQSLTPSYAPLGKPVAGLESPENKDQTLPPVEETNASEKNHNQSNQKIDAASADDQRGRGKDDKPAAELTEEEKQQMRELAATDREVHVHEGAQLLVQTQMEIALQRAATLAPHNGSAAASTAVDSFSAAAGHTLAPGSLFDQRS